MLPFLLYPIALIALADLPAITLLKRTMLAAPFAVLIAVFNPMLDTTPLLTFGRLTVTGGWVSFLSLILRFTLTVTAALVLLACTGIHGLCLALQRLGTPSVFTIQLLFLYRYLFLLVDETTRLVTAASVRSLGARAFPPKAFVPIVGHVLLRAVDRARRVYTAMTSRGFNGHIHTLKPLNFRLSDAAFTAFCLTFFTLARLCNLSRLIGSLTMEVLP
jgi:cobalt/nickel transport system permease protein